MFAERWTPIIMRNILYGCRTFNEIAAGAPGLSRSLLTKRLRELKRAGVIEILPKADGHGSRYEPTAAGQELEPVLTALGIWGDQWMEVRPHHSDPGVILWSWCQVYLRREMLPQQRVLVRFEFENRGKRETAWLLVEQGEAELCAFDPGVWGRPRRRREQPRHFRPLALGGDRLGNSPAVGGDYGYRTPRIAQGTSDLEPPSRDRSQTSCCLPRSHPHLGMSRRQLQLLATRLPVLVR